MKRGLTMLAFSSLIATIVAVLAIKFLAGPLLALLVGNAIAQFCALWVVIALVIKFDDALIIPLATKLVKKLGLQNIIKTE